MVTECNAPNDVHELTRFVLCYPAHNSFLTIAEPRFQQGGNRR